VSQYPEHGFVISREEARDLGLRIDTAENHPRWSKLKSLDTIISWKERRSFLKVFDDKELEIDASEDIDDAE
jgi:hypothetical protein